MAIIRQKRKKRFSIIDNQVIEDKNLSWGARGLLEYMLSKPDDWKFYMSELITHSKSDGRDKTYGFMNELKEHGYVIRKQSRSSNGKFGNQDLIVTDVPFTDFPDTAKPDTDSPDTAKPSLPNTDELNTDINNTYLNISSRRVSESLKKNDIKINKEKAEIINYYLSNLGEDVVLYVIQQTALANRPSFSYFSYILNRYEKSGIDTLEKAKNDTRMRKGQPVKIDGPEIPLYKLGE